MISGKTSAILKARILSEKEVFCKSLFLSARWFVMSQVAPSCINFVILPGRESAEYCASDLYSLVEGDRVFFLPSSGKNVERSNYKSSLSVQRTSAIQAINDYKEGTLYIISYPEALEEPVPDNKSISDCILKLSPGMTVKFGSIPEILFSEGFEKVDFVSAPGQFAVRGSIIDIFSYSDNNPFRISFWGDDIEYIKTFDCNTQLSVSEKSEALIVSSKIAECYEGGVSVFNILPKDTLLWLDSFDMYAKNDFLAGSGSFRKVYTDVPLDRQDAEPVVFDIAPQPVFNKNFDLLEGDIRSKSENGYKIYIFGERQSQLNRIESILSQNGCLLPQFVKGKNIHSGFIDREDRICCYSDHEIFDRFHRVAIRRSVEKTEQLTINDLNSFNIGDYVVHIDHGIGIFGGLVRIYDDHDRPKEVVKLTYRGGDVVFVSVNALHKISRFKPRDGEVPNINKLGSKTWQAMKNSAKSRVKDIAKDLINLYAKRKASKAYAFSPDTYLQEELESSFMYEDTPDQELATRAVKQDMEGICPMDRLVCGDVGFGKTEIAVRAAFKAATDGKQVAILVPTTILALQHYHTFSERLRNLPCTVDYVSRLRSAKEISSIKERLASGSIDILIGTHKIIGGAFEFRDLGLLIIDEEQKFGVAAKEKLRQMRSNIDTLTLTATPIPRTLQFSLLGARDLSIINTPPPNRIPVQTEIILFDKKEIKSIIEYELNRGGQIFFLHNKVEELDSIYEILHRLIPDMKICVAHGQMKAQDLEDRMLEFIRGDYDILLCTTIIENGLDIPNANTIIINQAQNIGLSDLHQLRGRVGRSNRKAFCYLIVPPLTGITEDARRRLRAIEEFSDLGSGFNIAMQDLDIRGAGNLLGAEQSGFITEMGFETYQKILAEAMEELGMEAGSVPVNAKSAYTADCTVETDKPARIPDEYIDITAEKIRIYKQLDSMVSEREIDNFASQLADRFGAFDEEVSNLFEVVKIRNIAASLGFEKVIVKNGMLIMFFISDQQSAYFESGTFTHILDKVNAGLAGLEFKQGEGKLKLITRGVDTLEKARSILSKLQ